MTKEELKVWFCNKFNSCYIVKHEAYSRSYFMYYDEKYIRYKKFARITGNEIDPPNIKDGICLFEQDYKNGRFYCDYDNIWSFFLENYCNNSTEIRVLINGWLKETDKLSALTTVTFEFSMLYLLKETDKLSALTTSRTRCRRLLLKETDKLSALTTFGSGVSYYKGLKETDKLSALTTSVKLKFSEENVEGD